MTLAYDDTNSIRLMMPIKSNPWQFVIKWHQMMVMEVDKVSDEVADVDADKVADMVVKITNEDFTHVILTIGDTFGDDVRGGAGGDGLGGSGR